MDAHFEHSPLIETKIYTPLVSFLLTKTKSRGIFLACITVEITTFYTGLHVLVQDSNIFYGYEMTASSH